MCKPTRNLLELLHDPNVSEACFWGGTVCKFGKAPLRPRTKLDRTEANAQPKNKNANKQLFLHPHTVHGNQARVKKVNSAGGRTYYSPLRLRRLANAIERFSDFAGLSKPSPVVMYVRC